MPDTPEKKVCTKCRIEKPIDKFGILTASGDGHNPLCFDCKRKRDHDSRAKQANRVKVSDRRSVSEKPKSAEPPEKKITAQHEEPAEAQLIRAFKKTTIKTFIKDDLIPMLERAVEERFK